MPCMVPHYVYFLALCETRARISMFFLCVYIYIYIYTRADPAEKCSHVGCEAIFRFALV